jgi:hypothetical protein
VGELESALDALDALAAEDLDGMVAPQLLDRTAFLTRAANRIMAELTRTVRRYEVTHAGPPRFSARPRALRPVSSTRAQRLSKTYDGLCDALDLTTKINRTGVIPDGGVLMHGDGSGRRIIGRRSRSPCPRSASWSRRPPSASSAGGAATWPSPPEGVRHRSGRPPLTVISRPSVWVRCAFVAELPSVHPDRAVL